MAKVIRSRALYALALLSVASLSSSSCSEVEGSRISACDELGDLCGKPCTLDFDCASGLYCLASQQQCTADCIIGGDHCKTGQTCNQRGRCMENLDLDGGGGSGANGGCPGFQMKFEKQTPTVVLLIDQSGSMTTDFPGGTRWTVLHSALMDPTNGVVARLEDQVRFGLALYTSHDGNAGGQCPILTEVAIALGNYQSIKTVYDAAAPDDETPTGESIQAVADQLVPFSEPGQKVIVLATDGEPDTCAEPNPQNGQQESVAAAESAFQRGIFTFVISVGRDTSAGHLQDVANAGRGLPLSGAQNAPFYYADDQAELTAAFDTIINGIRSCVFPLSGTVNPDRANEAIIRLDPTPGTTADSQTLVYQDPNGWQLVGSDKVELLGSACDEVLNGNPDVSGFFPCGVIDVPQ